MRVFMIKRDELILALLKIPRLGQRHVKKIMNNFQGEHFLDYNEIKSELKKEVPIFDINTFQKYIEATKNEIEKCENQSIRIKNYLDNDYPESLKNIDDCPIVIFIKGSEEILNKHERNIAIIGTRKPSKNGKQLAFDSAKLLSKDDHSIVSGLALGCDTAAHQGCLDTDGLTIAVLAHGLDIISPSSNTRLAKQIIEKGGVLVSEYSIETPPQNFMYVQRNRIQSALSKVVILIESDIKGGSMKTMEFAKKQGKEIWIYRPDIFGESTAGNEKLINESSNINENQSSIFELEKTKPKYTYFNSLDDIKKILIGL
jgi:DNA processing protein